MNNPYDFERLTAQERLEKIEELVLLAAVYKDDAIRARNELVSVKAENAKLATLRKENERLEKANKGLIRAIERLRENAAGGYEK